jgi:ubiquinone/menaquinone biosynthesis C-methylase UbiE
MSKEDEYILGTHDEEILRLGLQHRVWRPTVLECWRKAGITVGKRVLDLGAGPGYGTVDLAEIVGPAGEIVALELSSKFVTGMSETCRQRSIANVRIYELDLMTDEIPAGPFDFSWCRWVMCFVSDPDLAIKKVAAVLKKGGRAIFHEYGHYLTWRLLPPRPLMERFKEHVVESWRASGGEPDIGLHLPDLLTNHGLTVRSITPHIFCLRPNDYMWQWPATFIESYPDRLQELGVVDEKFGADLKNELADAEKTNSPMLTPLVLEVVAEKG